MIPEVELIRWLSSQVSVPVKSEVPKQRPKRFVSVERTGGPRHSVIIDQAQLDLFCWAETRAEALKLAHEVDDAMPRFAWLNNVFKVERQTFSWFPSSDGLPRYLVGYQVTVNAL